MEKLRKKVSVVADGRFGDEFVANLRRKSAVADNLLPSAEKSSPPAAGSLEVGGAVGGGDHRVLDKTVLHGVDFLCFF